jgi:ketosteroid isomerase-like protein
VNKPKTHPSSGVSAELAYVVQIERAEAKVGAREDITPLAVRATMLFRPEEDGEWKIVHRHADPITTPQLAESVILRVDLPSERTSTLEVG